MGWRLMDESQHHRDGRFSLSTMEHWFDGPIGKQDKKKKAQNTQTKLATHGCKHLHIMSGP
jgi:hypothetical protein